MAGKLREKDIGDGTSIDMLINECKDIQQTIKNLKEMGKWDKAIEEWRSVVMRKLDEAVKNVTKEVENTRRNQVDLEKSLEKLSSELNAMHINRRCTSQQIAQHSRKIEEYKLKANELSNTKLVKENVNFQDFIKIDRRSTYEVKSSSSVSRINDTPRNVPKVHDVPGQMGIPNDYNHDRTPEPVSHIGSIASPRLQSYSSEMMGVDQSANAKIFKLFQELKKLAPMNKNGPMSGNCDYQTTQMEVFLMDNFGFKNTKGYIVQGVKAFQLSRPVQSLDPRQIIYFPGGSSGNNFEMTVSEILSWQSSYKVYTDGRKINITSAFLKRALQGQSDYGKEAFLMKFVVRISKCPILMEFDAKTISRKLDEEWPHRIKLVSVTGVDFAGRIHDVDDIRSYVTNWRDVYEIDPKTNLPMVYDGRDFHRQKHAQQAILNEEYLFNDLLSMARTRLWACDYENVEIVVETGIGLGVFSGRYIGIDRRVRQLSAQSIIRVLIEDGPSYRKIRGIVFALPIFGDDPNQEVYHAFVDEFRREKYQGPIPVLFVDQDMHRLTVEIARSGFTVSELNPADSHGVFGEYWQNRGPAVEEKLALTTVGLLVQHHLINPNVLNEKNYIIW